MLKPGIVSSQLYVPVVDGPGKVTTDDPVKDITCELFAKEIDALRIFVLLSTYIKTSELTGWLTVLFTNIISGNAEGADGVEQLVCVYGATNVWVCGIIPYIYC
ncbi:MAG: hypothetical protein QW478_12950 [Candidatus Micrarchaeaceae archaeon]